MSAVVNDDQIQHLMQMLRGVPLFSELREDELRALAGISVSATFQPGQYLYRQGDDDKVMFVILSGRVALFHIDPQGVESFVEYREPGSKGWLGEAALLLGDVRDVTALVVAETAVLEVEREALNRLMTDMPGLRGHLTPTPENARRLYAPHFGWQAEGEAVVIFIRKHPWSLGRSMLVPSTMLVGAVLVASLLSATVPALSAVFWILAVLVPLPVAAFVIVDWRNDFYVLTDRRLVHEEKVPIIRQRREEAPLSAVQDVQFARTSFAAALLDFGDLTVETFAGSVAMKDVPQPEEVKDLIFREIERVRARTRATARKRIRDELEHRVGQKETPTVPIAVPVQEAPHRLPLWAILPGIVRYFFPSSREVVGDSVIYRKHWIVLLGSSKYPLAGLLFTVAATIIWWNRGLLIGALPDEAWIIWAALMVVFAAWALWLFEDWRNDLYILTSSRIIDIRRVPFLLQETRKEAGLDRIQTSEVVIPSPRARLLGYGDVIVRVAGVSGEFRFMNVRNPSGVQTEVSKRVDQFKRRQAEEEARTRRIELSDWFATYDQIKSGYTAPAGSPEPGESEGPARSVPPPP